MSHLGLSHRPSPASRHVHSKWATLVGIEVVLLTFNDLITARGGGSALSLVVSAAKDVVLAVLVVAALPRLLQGVSHLAALVAALAAFALASSLVAPNLLQGLYGFRNSYAGLLWLIVLPKLVQADRAQSLLRWISHVGQAAAVVAIVTYSRGIAWMFDLGVLPVPPGESFPHSYFLSGSERPRAFSPFVGPNELALGMLITVVAVWCTNELSRSRRMLLSLLPVTALLLSGSRSGLLGVILALTIVAVRSLPHRVFGMRMAVSALVSAATLFAGAAYLRQEAADPSLEGHRSSLVESAAHIVSNPVGSGAGTAGPRARVFDEDAVLTESYLLLVAIELGIVGVGLYIVVILRAIDRIRTGRTRLATASLAVLLGSLVSQLVLPTLQSTSVAWLLWIAVGLGMTSASSSDRRSLSDRGDRTLVCGQDSPEWIGAQGVLRR